MKYRVKAYLWHSDIIGEESEIRYKLQKNILFRTCWWTVNRSADKQKLEKQASELNLLMNN
jgi:hypothetical protein